MSGDNPVSVSVKWNKQVMPVVIEPSEPPAVLKSQLWTLTGVPPDRQTVLGFKGGKLKDDAEWSQLNLRSGMKLMLLGTPDDVRVAPPSDLPSVRDDLDLDSSDPAYEPPPSGPPGLVNLGNTCYMNATVQCLQSVSPLTSALSSFRGSTNALNPAEKLAASLRDTLSRLKSANTASINPTSFLSVLRQVNPQFAEQGQNGFYMQQDAEECWGELLTRLENALSLPDKSGNHVDKVFGFEMKSEDRCEESDEVVQRSENVRVLKCHISVNVSMLRNGILEGLGETIEKTSDKLERSAKWTRTSRMNALPPYLIVQFVRFFWKPTEGVKAKILRKVSFPVTLDVFDFCTDELKQKLSTKRDIKLDDPEPTAASTAGAQLAQSAQVSGEVIEAETGNYELCAVLTHRGRAADSGHYVAWVKDEGTRWYQFDDDKVTVHTEEEVKKLSGGGDWHMAYMCLYRAKK